MATGLEIAKLDVGGVSFECYVDTLTHESPYFKKRYSLEEAEKEKAAAANNEGYLFVDRDGELFKHILDYLRNFKSPLFWDQVDGHDAIKYLQLLEEADFYGLERLAQWLKDGKYLGCVTVETKVHIQDCDEPNTYRLVPAGLGNTETKLMSVTENVYSCPRNIAVHRNDPGRCGKDCRKKWEDIGPEYKPTQVLKLVEIRNEVTVARRSVYEAPNETTALSASI